MKNNMERAVNFTLGNFMTGKLGRVGKLLGSRERKNSNG